MIKYLDFEKPIQEIDFKIHELNKLENKDNKLKINQYNFEKKNLLKKIYSKLNAWQKVQVARHPDRPHCLDYVNQIIENFVPLSGDKRFGEDHSVVSGLGKIDGKSVMIIGTEKGSTMEDRIKHNFGMAKPEGYRKAQRIMMLAEKLNLPVITFVDTAGAFPGKDAEERGQSESIASSIATSLKIKIPIISYIIGEGGSGGAIALATADRVIMLSNSIYSVISPEGCSSILWRSSDYIHQAAESLKLTAQDCLKYNIIDEIVMEFEGGAHRHKEDQIQKIKENILKNLMSLEKIPKEILINERNEKYLSITSNI